MVAPEGKEKADRRAGRERHAAPEGDVSADLGHYAEVVRAPARRDLEVVAEEGPCAMDCVVAEVEVRDELRIGDPANGLPSIRRRQSFA